MAKTEAQRERQRRWVRKHPKLAIKKLEKWISKEKDSKKLERAKAILEKYKKR